MIYELVANSWLIVEQSVETNIKGFVLEHWLVLTDVVDQNLLGAASSSFLRVRQLATVVKTTNLSVGQSITLTQSTLPRCHVEEVQDFIFIWQEAVSQGQMPLARGQLHLAQSVDVQVAKGCYATLDLRQDVSFNITRNLSVSQVLTLQSTAVVYKPSKYWTAFDVVLEAP